MNRRVEIEQGEEILDAGISLPLFWKLRVVIKRPYIGTMSRMGIIFLSMGVDYQQMISMSKKEWLEFYPENSKPITKIVAYAICRGRLRGWLFGNLMAWLLRKRCTDIALYAIFKEWLNIIQMTPFLNIIKSTAVIQPLKRRAAKARRS